MAEFRFSCPGCGQEIQAESSLAGSGISCPACRRNIVVPPAPNPPATPSPKSTALRVSLLVVSGLVLILVVAFSALVFSRASMRHLWEEWAVLAGAEGQWEYANGKISGQSVDGDSILASAREYGDVTFSATVNTPDREASLAFRMRDATNGYLVVFAPVTPTCRDNGFVALIRRVDNQEKTLGVYRRKNLVGNKAVRLTVIAHGPAMEVQLDGKRILRANDSTFSVGRLGFRMYGWGDNPCDATFSRVTFQ